MKRARKQALSDLHLHGGPKLFDTPISTSNLVRPDVERFLAYSRRFYDAQQYTNRGPLVQELERRLAAFHQVSHCVSFSNGFWALVLAIHCLALPNKTEVVMPSLTYRRLGDAVNWAGLVPRFCEVDESTLAISAKTAEPHLGSNTALILGVHPIVNCCDAAGLEHLAKTHSIPLLFDGVESVFETLGGRKIGTFGRAEIFSLHASKLINGFEGGYLTTDSPDLAERLSFMRGFAFSSPDSVLELGTNAKLNEMHAAMALASLDDLEAQVERNQKRYRIYQQQLAEFDGIRLLTFDESEKTSYKNIVVELTEVWPLSNAQTIRYLNSEGILARTYYSPPLHSKPTAYAVIGSPMPLTERLAKRFLLLPCGHLTSTEDILAVVDFLRFLKMHSQKIQETDV